MKISHNITRISVLLFLNIYSFKCECDNEPLLAIGNDINCIYGPYNTSVSCSEPIRFNTTAILGCQYGYEAIRSQEDQENRSYITCDKARNKEDSWSNVIPRCKFDCAGTKLVDKSDMSYSSSWKQASWHILIYKSDNIPVCAGVLINARLVLSHAGCLQPHEKSDLIVYAGKFYKLKDYYEKDYIVSGVKNIYVNRDYTNANNADYGNTKLAIIELEKILIFNPLIRPGCTGYPDFPDIPITDSKALMATWGKRFNCNEGDEDIRIAKIMKLKNYSECSESRDSLMESETPYMYPSDTFCYKYDSNKTEIGEDCYGLQGSALFYKSNKKNRNVLMGLVHYQEVLTMKNSTKRYIKSFINILPQKNFIKYYLDNFDSDNLTHPKFTNQYCEGDICYYPDDHCSNKELLQIGRFVLCNYGQYNSQVPCEDPIKVGTTVQLNCNFGYEVVQGRYHIATESTCERVNGRVQWSQYIPPCVPFCSLFNQFKPLQRNFAAAGEEVLASMPWNVLIYKFDNLPICGGVVINARFVLSLAGCLQSHDKSELTVIAGKYHQARSDVDYNTQVSQIKNIYINENYTNNINNSGIYGNTRLAVIELETLLEFTLFVASACSIYAWPNYYHTFDLNSTGVVARFTGQYRSRRILELDEIKNFEHSCTTDSNLIQFSSDVFCAKTDLVSNVDDEECNGLSGSGLFDATNGGGKHFLWGLVLHNELVTYENATKRCHKSFVDLTPQNDFIRFYSDYLNTGHTLHPKYVKKLCEINLQEVLDKDQLEIKCYYQGRIIPCQSTMKPGTILKSKCKFGYIKKDITSTDEIQCLPGPKWSDELLECEKICGQISPKNKFSTLPLLFKGNDTEIVNVPWHVAIYANNTPKNEGIYIQICGGTLVHSNIVITAAHCFWDSDLSKPFDESFYLIAVGKQRRNFGASERQRIQYSKILEITIPTTYNELFLRHDIAILVLERNFQFNAYTKPACLEFLPFGNYDIGDGVKGRVAGWGHTSSAPNSNSFQLKSAEISTLTNNNCKQVVDANFIEDITGEKFCAQGKEGQTACQGDSGGGFLVPRVDKDDVERYYLWGVVSSGLDYTVYCTEKFFSTYTNLQYHQDIIKVIIANQTLLQD